MSIILVFYPGIVRPVVSPVDDGINHVSTVVVCDFAVSDRISSARTITWKITARGISAQKQSAFNTLARSHKIGWLEGSSLVRPVVYSIDSKNFVPSVAFGISVRKSLSRKFSFGIRQRKTTKYKVYFDMYNYMFAHFNIRFNALQKIHSPGVTNGSWVNQLNEPIVKPVSYANVTAPSAIEWNSQKTIKRDTSIRFNDKGKLTSQRAVNFNDNGVLVVCRKSVTWETLERI